MKGSILLLVCALVGLVNTLHFYVEDSKPKCFLEELPKDTIVHGAYRIEEYSTQLSAFVENPSLSVTIDVKEVISQHQIVKQKGSHIGKITFTATESGEHSICIGLTDTKWFASKRIRVRLDLVIGELTHEDDLKPDTKLDDLSYRIRDLNYRLADIRREQRYQREREMTFRNISEQTNSQVITWSLLQLFVLGITCAWQSRHLKSFFTAKKLV